MSFFLFQLYPYLVFIVFIVASLFRYDKNNFSWTAKSSQIFRKKQLILGSILFHVGIIMLFLGHFIGLFTPLEVLKALGIKLEWKQLLAAVSGGFAGILCFVGLTLLLHRRIFDARVRKNTSFMDIFILLLLYVELVIGLVSIPLSLNHLDGKDMQSFMLWAQSIVRIDKEAYLHLEEVPFIFRLHIFLGLTIFLVFPFSRLVHILSFPFRYFFRTPQIVRRKKNIL